MITHADRAVENSDRSVANKVSKNKGKTNFQLKDNSSINQKLTSHKKENNTGLPDKLKSGVENLSGFSMDDVKVYYNSNKPAQLKAHAYTKGTEIHLASGQEKHLPHEAWHVVQQKQGRVKPTMQMKENVSINDDKGLEGEAEMMGRNVAQPTFSRQRKLQKITIGQQMKQATQLKTKVTWTTQNFEYNDPVSGQIQKQVVGEKMEADLDPNDKKTGNSTTSKEMPNLFNALKASWNPGTKYWVRGHLLNDHLGGPNVNANLFPITGHANGEHLEKVESYVKDWMRANRTVRYEVNAIQESGTVNQLRKAGGKFECYAYTKNGGQKEVVNRTILSIPSLHGGVAASGYRIHNKNWIQQNDNMILKGNKSNANLPQANAGMDEQGRQTWETANAKIGWIENYYQIGS